MPLRNPGDESADRVRRSRRREARRPTRASRRMRPWAHRPEAPPLRVAEIALAEVMTAAPLPTARSSRACSDSSPQRVTFERSMAIPLPVIGSSPRSTGPPGRRNRRSAPLGSPPCRRRRRERGSHRSLSARGCLRLRSAPDPSALLGRPAEARHVDRPGRLRSGPVYARSMADGRGQAPWNGQPERLPQIQILINPVRPPTCSWGCLRRSSRLD